MTEEQEAIAERAADIVHKYEYLCTCAYVSTARHSSDCDLSEAWDQAVREIKEEADDE